MDKAALKELLELVDLNPKAIASCWFDTDYDGKEIIVAYIRWGGSWPVQRIYYLPFFG